MRAPPPAASAWIRASNSPIAASRSARAAASSVANRSEAGNRRDASAAPPSPGYRVGQVQSPAHPAPESRAHADTAESPVHARPPIARRGWISLRTYGVSPTMRRNERLSEREGSVSAAIVADVRSVSCSQASSAGGKSVNGLLRRRADGDGRTRRAMPDAYGTIPRIVRRAEPAAEDMRRALAHPISDCGEAQRRHPRFRQRREDRRPTGRHGRHPAPLATPPHSVAQY